LTVYYWKELNGATMYSLADPVSSTDEYINLATPGEADPGAHVQIDAEVLRVEEILDGGLTYRVARGMHDTTASAHSAGTHVYHLEASTTIVPFVRDFFGTPYSGNWTYPISLPDAKVACAELFVTNGRGNSDAASVSLTQGLHYGLRTLSGGQYSIQVDGYLAADQSPAPVVLVEASHPVRDIRAFLTSAADAPVKVRINRNDLPYCLLTIPAQYLASDVVDGYSLEPLTIGDRLTISILSVGATYPGSDLTVTIRL
jgi:hypothetical protein